MSKGIKRNKPTSKKTLEYTNTRIGLNPDLKVFFFDEGRFGLQTTLTRIWAKRGQTLNVKVKQSYENFYAYSSISYQDGDSFTLFLPWVNTEMMNLYLAELKLAYPEDEILLIMDQAGWHKSKELIIPDKIEIIYLPPYSPELNPVEKFWKHLKSNLIHNVIFKSISFLQDTLENYVFSLNNDTLKSLCACSYL